MIARLPALFILAALVWAQQSTDEERERRLRIPEIIRALELKEGDSVADVGAGGGFYSSRLARAVGESGRVYAEDIDEKDSIASLRKRIEKERLTNVTVILGAPDDPKLPTGALDAVLMVNAYHEMDRYPEMLRRVREALKPGGRLVVVDIMALKTRSRPRAVQTKNHVLAPDLAESEIRAAGFEIAARDDRFIDRPDEEQIQWMLIARRPPAAEPARDAVQFR